MGKFHTLYRISDGGYSKEKLEHADKIHCLKNYLNVFGSEGLLLFADNCKPSTIEKIKEETGIDPVITSWGTHSASWRGVVEYAFAHFNDTDSVYLLEDDFLHLEGSKDLLLEGLEIADYVSLYDHPDKYLNAKEGGNPLIKYGGEECRVLLTRSTHWKTTNSTTMTFCTSVGQLKQDKKVWWKYTRKPGSDSFKAFRKLQKKGRRLITSIPGRSTHIEKAWLSPLTNWEKV